MILLLGVTIQHAVCFYQIVDCDRDKYLSKRIDSMAFTLISHLGEFARTFMVSILTEKKITQAECCMQEVAKQRRGGKAYAKKVQTMTLLAKYYFVYLFP